MQTGSDICFLSLVSAWNFSICFQSQTNRKTGEKQCHKKLPLFRLFWPQVERVQRTDERVNRNLALNGSFAKDSDCAEPIRTVHLQKMILFPNALPSQLIHRYFQMIFISQFPIEVFTAPEQLERFIATLLGRKAEGGGSSRLYARPTPRSWGSIRTLPGRILGRREAESVPFPPLSTSHPRVLETSSPVLCLQISVSLSPLDPQGSSPPCGISVHDALFPLQTSSSHVRLLLPKPPPAPAARIWLRRRRRRRACHA